VATIEPAPWRGRNQDDLSVEEAVATQTTVTLVDDLDGSTADEQVEFTVDGKSYAIDLSDANSKKLREVFAPYVSAARRAGGRRSGGAAATPAARPKTDREQNQAIREWAQKKGLKVSERGRISASVLDAFKAAH
jgi:Lsr2